MSFNLDSTDKKILRSLIRDARIKVVDIASYVGVTSAAIHLRIAKIKKAGIIKEFTIKLDERKMGYSSCAFVGVFMDKNSNYSIVVDQLRQIDEVVEAYYTTGQYGLFVKVYARDNDHLMKVLNGKIQKLKGIVRTETFISLEEPIQRNIMV